MNSKELKQYFKENGIETKNISIRHSYFGYSDGFDVTIKDISISRKKVEHLLKKYESIDRDERTGEILAGGNTYIQVSYDYDSIQEKLDEYNVKILDYISNELSKESEDNKQGYLNGNLCLRLAVDIICFKDGNEMAIRDMSGYCTCRCSERNMSKTLLNMGILDKVYHRISSLEKSPLNETIKLWYTKAYPSDYVGRTLSDTATFQNLNDCINNGEDVYELLGGDADSNVRERCFQKLAEFIEQDYDVIYQKLFNGDKDISESDDYGI